MSNMKVTLSAGGGGKAMGKLISGIILKYFKSAELAQLRDASYIKGAKNMAFCTDSFVITPEFFPGGNIGKLAVAGTTNDLACSGAVPLYISCALVIPEGYDLDELEAVIKSFAEAAEYAGVEVVTGDTKVVPKGELKGLVINTAGVGVVQNRWNDYSKIKVGDIIIISSDIARHGISVFLAREELGFHGEIESDCNVLCKMLQKAEPYEVHFVRDATRGGVAAVMNEIASMTGLGISLDEELIPMRDDVSHMCETLGFDPLAVANEGAAVIVVSENDAAKVLKCLQGTAEGAGAAICGTVTTDGKVILHTLIGGTRYIETPLGEILPRIC